MRPLPVYSIPTQGLRYPLAVVGSAPESLPSVNIVVASTRKSHLGLDCIGMESSHYLSWGNGLIGLESWVSSVP